ncbi:MAG TPA: sigma-54 dependent transcriptional regulator [Vicinamibacterales bacterium]|nr:sigma-54 dependent transcriptional regulator [Vicinamibacterales bacterium]
MADILVVDDDQSVASAFENFLSFEGHTCRLASNAEDAMRLIAARRPALVMMDVRMPGVDGLSALKQIRTRFPDLYVVMMTGYGTSQTSIDAIRGGAYDYLTKPLDLEEIRDVIRKALAAQQTRTSAETATTAEPLPRLVGSTPAMRDVYKTIGRLAGIDVPALVTGEHGTGKQLVIAAIHENSPRAARPFRVLDCGTLPETTIETGLFDGSDGTVQLANVEKLPVALQVRLARALGDPLARHDTADRLTARVIASTETELAAVAQSGAFNRELCAALSVATVKLPPLRERREDIPLLVRHFIQRFNVEFDRAIAGVDDRVLAILQDYSWPGNVAELETVVKSGCILARSDVITVDEIGDRLGERRAISRGDAESALAVATRTALQERLVNAPESEPSSAYHDIIDVVETALVQEALKITNNNQVKAAIVLGVNRATLRKKIPGD